jgi:hypothetical protein
MQKVGENRCRLIATYAGPPPGCVPAASMHGETASTANVLGAGHTRSSQLPTRRCPAGRRPRSIRSHPGCRTPMPPTTMTSQRCGAALARTATQSTRVRPSTRTARSHRRAERRQQLNPRRRCTRRLGRNRPAASPPARLAPRRARAPSAKEARSSLESWNCLGASRWT